MPVDFLNKIAGSYSKTFLAFCFCFMLGAAVPTILDIPGAWFYYFYISAWLGGGGVVLFWSRPVARVAAVGVLFLLIGFLRTTAVVPLENDTNSVARYRGLTVALAGLITEEAAVKENSKNYVLRDIALLGGDGAKTRSVGGGVMVYLPLYSEYRYGDRLAVVCRLDEPGLRADSSFRYDKYLAVRRIQALCYTPKSVKVLPERNGGIFSGIIALKEVIRQRVAKLWREPQSLLVSGILYGDRAGLPADFQDRVSRVGLSHILAVSGYNVAIVVLALMSSLIAVGLYRRQAFLFAVVGIAFFALFSGGSASVVRAALMGVAVLLAGYVGRPARSANVIMLAAVLMTMVNPYVVLWDIGFQLSFLAALGLIYLSPILKDRFRAGDSPVRQIIADTLSATVVTTPLILYYFGRLSIVALPANIAVLLLIPWIMLFSFGAIILSFVFWPFGQVVAWVTDLGLQYIMAVINWLGAKQWAAAEMTVSFWLMAVLYAIIIIIARRFSPVIASVAKQSHDYSEKQS
ncbi:MAG: ComEC/Rec2 family competence protein [Patescibacteria group bacterium]|nr:ComEC/Rec2 family competence protein [Patescibacteria group bacterium]